MTKALSLTCECGGFTKIIDHANDSNGYKRKRACFRCGHSFITYEVGAKDWKLLNEFRNILKKYERKNS